MSKVIVVACVCIVVSLVIAFQLSISIVAEFSALHKDIALQELESAIKVKLINIVFTHFCLFSVFHLIMSVVLALIIANSVTRSKHERTKSE
jgi:hypothetical protein